MILTVEGGQNIVDIALQKYGCYEGVFTLMVDNGLSLTPTLTAGQQLQVRDEVPKITSNNKAIAAVFASNYTVVNTGHKPVDSVEPEAGFFDNEFYNTEFYN